MRTQLNAVLLLLASICFAAPIAPALAADGDQYLGTWSGSWAGAEGAQTNMTAVKSTIQRSVFIGYPRFWKS